MNSNFKDIKTLEDAFKVTGMPVTPEFNEIPLLHGDEEPERLREYFKAVYEAVVVTKALVGDWKADWNDENQIKYYPCFYMSSGDFFFYGTSCSRSNVYVGDASRLCFPTGELAEYAGRQFTDIYSRLILK